MIEIMGSDINGVYSLSGNSNDYDIWSRQIGKEIKERCKIENYL